MSVQLASTEMLYIGSRTNSHSLETQRALHAADGYLYLKMPAQALEELACVPLPEHQDPSVMLARVRVMLHLQLWREAEALSGEGTVLHPEEEEFTVQRAFALHQLKNGERAVEVLLAAPEWLRRTGILHYNLACYEARLGDLGTARQCIRAAIQINSAMKKNARTDPDLEELWN